MARHAHPYSKNASILKGEKQRAIGVKRTLLLSFLREHASCGGGVTGGNSGGSHARIKAKHEEIVMVGSRREAGSFTRLANHSGLTPAMIRRCDGFFVFHGGKSDFPPGRSPRGKKKPLRCDTGGAKVV